MNKQKVSKELSDIGIKVKSFEFTAAGYLIQVWLDSSSKGTWEDLECLSISGFEIVRIERINQVVKQIILIPANEQEFSDYIKRYVKAYNLHQDFAIIDLTCIAEKYGSITVRNRLDVYKSVIIREDRR